MRHYLKLNQLLVGTMIVLTPLIWLFFGSSVSGALFLVSIFLAALSALLMNKTSCGRFFNVGYKAGIIPRWFATLTFLFIFGGMIYFLINGSFPTIEVITLLFLLLAYCLTKYGLGKK